MRKDLMSYKDYFGSVHYSEADRVFFGIIEGIDDSVTFEGSSVDELRASFEEAVEDYLLVCAEIEKEPLKPYRGTFNIRVDPLLHKKLALEAVKSGISLNQLVVSKLKIEN